MKVKSMCPAGDWFYVTKPTQPRNETTVWPIAVWANNEDGEVFGMVSIPKITLNGQPTKSTLVSVPPVDGMYKHLRELSAVEQQALADGVPAKVS